MEHLIYLSIYPSINLSIFLSIYLSVYHSLKKVGIWHLVAVVEGPETTQSDKKRRKFDKTSQKSKEKFA